MYTHGHKFMYASIQFYMKYLSWNNRWNCVFNWGMYIPALLPKSHVSKIKEQETTTNRVRNWRLFVGDYWLQHSGLPTIKPCRRKSPPGCNRQVLCKETAKMSFYFPTITEKQHLKLLYVLREQFKILRIYVEWYNSALWTINLTHRVQFTNRHSTNFLYDFCFPNMFCLFRTSSVCICHRGFIK